jgi:hypothetical protein
VSRRAAEVRPETEEETGRAWDEGMAIAWRVHNDGKAVVRVGPRPECERVAPS